MSYIQVFELPSNIHLKFMSQVVEQCIEWGLRLNHPMRDEFVNKLVQLIVEGCLKIHEQPQQGIAVSENGSGEIVAVTLETGLRPQGLIAEALRRASIAPSRDLLPANTKVVISFDGSEVKVEMAEKAISYEGGKARRPASESVSPVSPGSIAQIIPDLT